MDSSIGNTPYTGSEEVVIHSLHSIKGKRLNGKSGAIISPLNVNGRYGVSVNEKNFLILPLNLRNRRYLKNNICCTDSTQNSLADINLDLLYEISKYCAPADVYQMCLCIRKLHVCDDVTNVPVTLPATKMLGISLRIGLTALLRHKCIPSIECLYNGFETDELIISDSSILQVIHRKSWTLDIDLYMNDRSKLKHLKASIDSFGYSFDKYLMVTTPAEIMNRERFTRMPSTLSSSCSFDNSDDELMIDIVVCQVPDLYDYISIIFDEVDARDPGSTCGAYISAKEAINLFFLEEGSCYFNGSKFFIKDPHLTLNNFDSNGKADEKCCMCGASMGTL